jgi:hypothetical protein
VERNKALREQVRAKKKEITALRDENSALRDLLDLKTKEVLLREKLESREEDSIG